MKTMVLLLGCLSFAACKSNKHEADSNEIKDYKMELAASTIVPDTTAAQSGSPTDLNYIVSEMKPDDNFIRTPEIPVMFDDVEPLDISVNDFYAAVQKLSQQFTLLNENASTITLKAGTRIQFDAGSFIDPETGKLAKGNVEITVKEFYDKSDFVINKLTTQTENNILESGGMVNIEARVDGKLLTLAPGKQVNLYFNQPGNSTGMQTFLGKYDQDNSIIWSRAIRQNDSIVNAPVSIFNSGDILCFAEEMPEFPGGTYLLYRYLQCNIDYPRQAIEQQIEGKVYIEFTVSDSGYVQNAKVKKGIGGGCDEAALNAVLKMPRWRPAIQNGINISTKYTLPVGFDLTDNELNGMIEIPNGNYDIAYVKCGDGSLEKAIAEALQSEYFLRGYKSTAKQDSLIRNNVGFSNQYMISSASLGWINCDRYLSSPGKRITCKVEAPGAANTKVTLIFNNYNAVLAGSRVGNVSVFTSVPQDEPVTIFCIKTENEKFYYSLDQFRADENLLKVTDMQPGTIDEIISALKQLNKSTAIIN